MNKVLMTLMFFVLLPLSVMASDTVTNPGVYFISPADGATIDGTFTVKFGLSGIGVAPAGVDKANTGHHHLLIDMPTLPDLTVPLPTNDNIRHFGGGQTEAEITLAPGTHTLQLILGDFMHVPHQPPVISEKITITVLK